MSPATIQLALRGTDRDSVLAELTAFVPDLLGRAADQQRLLRALLERENMHSTGLGDGIALPHTRDTLGGLVTQPVIVFGRHPTGISYNAIDGRPVRLLFLLVTTSVTQPGHVQFTDTSTHAGQNDQPPAGWAYAWDFTDDGTFDSSERNPSHDYGVTSGTFEKKSKPVMAST